MRLQTPRLLLRELVEADAPHLLALNSDPTVTRYTDMAGQSPDLLTIQTVELPAYLAEYARHPGLGTFAAIEQVSEEFIGWFMLRPFSEAAYFDPAYPFPGDLEVGYRLKRSAWGRGLASEGVAALLEHGRKLAGDGVMAVVMSDNIASVRVLKKCGLTQLEFGTPDLHFYRQEKA